MFSILAAISLSASSAGVADRDSRECAQKFGASQVASALNEVPQEIRADLAQRIGAQGSAIADRDVPLLTTDAPSVAERGHAQVRFSQAIKVRDRWFVQLEIALFAGVRTFTYNRQPDGTFAFSPGQHFGGPACESIKAALAGVTTFGPI